nr:protein kinase-like domain, concanavalin A-like lectin/glucanase domain protein [Tanacetum cinerariifolium]GEZ80327.1 protein kinase-like domain, concanavalin A-like lectin/glucanase domain protein [Tanacetum cinerariifolium]
MNSFQGLAPKVPHHGIDLWLQVQIFYDHVNPVTRRTIDQSASGKHCDRNAEESWELLEVLSLYDNESWNDLRDFANLRTQLRQQQDDMISKINILWKTISEKLDDAPIHDAAGNPAAQMNFTAKKETIKPWKIYNFMGRFKRLKVFVGDLTYECDFIVLEDTTSVIDHDLGSVIFGKPFVEATGLVYDREEGTITFEKDKEKIVFKIPHKMEMFKHIDFTDIKTDCIPPFAIESDNDSIRKTHYSNSLDLGPEYKYDDNVCRAIRS